MPYKWSNRNRGMTILSHIPPHTLPQMWNISIKYMFSRKKEYLKYSPIKLGLYVSDRCTLRCNICVNHAPNRPLNYRYSHQPCEDLSFDNFKKILGKFRSSIKLSLAGVGEPFLNKNIFDMIKYGSACKMKVSTITNGTILHDKIGHIIQSPLSSIDLSLDAHNASAYNKMRGGSKQTFNNVLENITKLVENRNKSNSRLKVGLTYVCTRSNYKYIPDMVKLADEMNADELSFQNLIPSPMRGFTENQCLYEDNIDVYEVISSVDEPKSNLIVYMPIPLQRTVTERLCKSHFNSIFVDAKGNVSGCGRVMAPNKEYGNVYKDKNIWNNSHFRRMRRMFLNKSTPLLDCCKTCVNNSNYKQIILCKSE